LRDDERGYLHDRLVENPDVENKRVVLDYFKFFQSLNDQIADQRARSDFLTKINGVIQTT
jgi:hypothetical protein